MAEEEVEYCPWFEREGNMVPGLKYRMCRRGDTYWLEDNSHEFRLFGLPENMDPDRSEDFVIHG